VRITRRVLQLSIALVLVAASILLAALRGWPFGASPPRLAETKPSLWQLLLADRVTLGFVRLAIVLASVFVVASVPALIVGGRWLRGFGAGGVTADDAADGTAAVGQLRTEVRALHAELYAARKEHETALTALSRVPLVNEEGDE
jgi:hypothetical protein